MSKRRLGAILAVLAAAAFVGVHISTASAATAVANALVKGVGSGRCLSPPASDGGQSTIQDCANQRWSTTDTGQITINGKCLDAFGQNTANGTSVTVWTCNSGTNQKWTVNADGTIVGAQSRRCVDVKGEATGNGTLVQLFDCHGGTNQKWQLVGASPTPSTSTGPETIGTGDYNNPALGPGPSNGLGDTSYRLVKNWNFGTNGTIKSMADMDSEFYYHDQFGTIANGTNYGAITAASSTATRIHDANFGDQPVDPSIRQITGDSVKTFLKPLNGAQTVSPTAHNAINGSFMAKWAPARGGTLLGRNILWQTRVRFVSPQYFWFALWNAGNQWDGGAEFDVVESFGWLHSDGGNNFDGRYWHADPVGGTGTVNYSDWPTGMRSVGVNSFDATAYHTWSLLYRTNDTYEFWLDNTKVQSGTMQWTLGGGSGGTPIDFHFLFDAGWGHTQVGDVNHSMAAANFNEKYYEFDYSRVYQK
jgi:hypothetical protein